MRGEINKLSTSNSSHRNSLGDALFKFVPNPNSKYLRLLQHSPFLNYIYRLVHWKNNTIPYPISTAYASPSVFLPMRYTWRHLAKVSRSREQSHCENLIDYNACHKKIYFKMKLVGWLETFFFSLCVQGVNSRLKPINDISFVKECQPNFISWNIY